MISHKQRSKVSVVGEPQINFMNNPTKNFLKVTGTAIVLTVASSVFQGRMYSISDSQKLEWTKALQGLSSGKPETGSPKESKSTADKKSSQSSRSHVAKSTAKGAKRIASAPALQAGKKDLVRAMPVLTGKASPTSALPSSEATTVKKSEWMTALAALEGQRPSADKKAAWLVAKTEEKTQPVVEPEPVAKPSAEVVRGEATKPIVKSDTSMVAGVIDPQTKAGRKGEVKAPAMKETAGIQYSEEWPKWLKVGFQYRGRGEGPSGIGFSKGNQNSYYLNRVRVEASITPTSWLRLFLQGQDAQAFAYGTAAKPSSMVDTFDLRQAYVDFGKPAARGLSFRLGRQELNYGGQRLVGALEWGNGARTFDAARLAFFRPGIKADVFASSAVQLEQGRFDHHKPGENFYGSYVVLDKLVGKATVEPYFFWKTLPRVIGERGDTADSDIYTSGMRFVGKLPLRFDYTLEAAQQWGSYASDSVAAWAGSYVLGWTVNTSALKPRFHVEFSHASGDSGNQDGRRGTFDQLFPTNHPYYGIADQMGWRNMRNGKLGFEFNPSKKVRIQTDFHEFYLASTQDGFYNAGGTRVVLNRLATSSHVGSETDFQLMYLISKELSFGAGVGHLFPGEYLKQSGKNAGYTFPYFMWNIKF